MEKKIAEEETLILKFLHQMAPDSSMSTLRSWIKEGRVTIEGRSSRRSDQIVQKGEKVVIQPKGQFIRGAIRLLYEDFDIVVLEKPEGLLSVATDSGGEANVHSFLKRQFSDRRVYPVHRLDRETSGIMLFAFSKRAQEEIKKQFHERQIDKTYYAVVEGEVALEKGRWESLLVEDAFYFVKSSSSPKGKQAITDYERLAIKNRRSLLRLKPLTGRKNQLRVHCSEAGHPLVGDKKYGASSNVLKRLCLHAQALSFCHPSTGKRLHFSLTVPESFHRLFE